MTRLSLVVVILASALCGALAYEFVTARRAAPDVAPATTAITETAQQTDRYADLVEADRTALAAIRSRNDSLIHDRLRLRAVVTSSNEGERPDVVPNLPERIPVHPAQMLRVDDRLVAELVLERHRTRQLETRYEDLIESYRLHLELVNRRAATERLRFRRRQRRTIITAVALSVAVTYILSDS